MTAVEFRWMALVSCLCWGTVVAQTAQPERDPADGSTGRMWSALLDGATSLHLPTTFLKDMPADFIHFEFEDLHAYSAEYHPGEHRMVLNRRLSFNSAGRTLRPLLKMTSKEIEVLYHELFHAYMDWLVSRESHHATSPDKLLAFARAEQSCRYQAVVITPVVQRAQETEVRYLTEGEAWEALNETWAVFIGWAVWNQLELQRTGGGAVWQQPRLVRVWQSRLVQAAKSGELRGYYVPEDPDERRVAQKRFLASTAQLSSEEMTVLMKQVLGLSDEIISHSKNLVARFLDFSQRAACERHSG